MMQYYSHYIETPWGEICLCYSRRYGVCYLYLPGSEPPDPPPRQRLPWTGLIEDIRRYFRGEKVEFRYPLDLSGLGVFSRQVLGEVLRIPFGATRSYGEIARYVGCPGGARAVGRVMARNPVPLLIPCHRVVRHDGSPGGFTVGQRWKKYLLELENSCHRESSFDHSPVIR